MTLETTTPMEAPKNELTREEQDILKFCDQQENISQLGKELNAENESFRQDFSAMILELFSEEQLQKCDPTFREIMHV
ncbi:hypothetical protein J5893_02025 [bacterium]|nr:hypothetical protein [bacterium]